MERSTTQQLMDAARKEAQQSWTEGGIPIGAVLSREDGTIMARGHNQRVQNGDPTTHGETQCIRNDGRRRDWLDLTLGTTPDSRSPQQKAPACAGAFRSNQG